jgi:Spy/CpxP family protein refolding chaperone
MKIRLSILIFAVFAIAVLAQPAPHMPPDAPPQWEDGPDRDKLRERIEMIKMWKLVEMLALTPEQSIIFFPIYNANEREREELRQIQRELFEQLEREVAAQKLNEKTAERLTDSLIVIRNSICRSETEFYSQISTLLDVRQKAMFALFEKRFAEEVRNIIEAGKGGKPPRPR